LGLLPPPINSVSNRARRRREIRHIAGVSDSRRKSVRAMAGGAFAVLFPVLLLQNLLLMGAKPARRKGSRRRLL
jgi:hypothetical protein